MKIVAGNGVGLVRRERWHALARSVSIRIAAQDTEGEAIELVGARPRDAPAEPLVRAREETRVAVRAVGARHARHASVHAHAVFAGKAGDAVIGIIASGLFAKTPADAEVALVGGIRAVPLVFASAATDHEATREILAARQETGLARRTGVVFVAESLRVRARGAKHGSLAPRTAAVGDAAARATVRSPTVRPTGAY